MDDQTLDTPEHEQSECEDDGTRSSGFNGGSEQLPTVAEIHPMDAIAIAAEAIEELKAIQQKLQDAGLGELGSIETTIGALTTVPERLAVRIDAKDQQPPQGALTNEPNEFDPTLPLVVGGRSRLVDFPIMGSARDVDAAQQFPTAAAADAFYSLEEYRGGIDRYSQPANETDGRVRLRADALHALDEESQNSIRRHDWLVSATRWNLVNRGYTERELQETGFGEIVDLIRGVMDHEQSECLTDGMGSAGLVDAVQQFPAVADPEQQSPEPDRATGGWYRLSAPQQQDG